MNDFNRVQLIGRVTQQAELKYTQTNLAIANFSIAVNVTKKNGDQTEEVGHFFRVTVFGKYAEVMRPHLIKGKQIHLEGELRQNKWTDDQGNQRQAVGIVARDIQLLSSPKNQESGNNGDSHQGAPGQGSSNQSQGGRSPQGNNTYQGNQEPPSAPEYYGEFEDDIPF